MSFKTHRYSVYNSEYECLCLLLSFASSGFPMLFAATSTMGNYVSHTLTTYFPPT